MSALSVSKARQILAILVLVSISSLIVPAQEQKQPAEEKPRKVKSEPNKAFKQWINDHDVFLTQSERDAWKKLDNDDEREKFIETIWRSRDPDPDTEENEFKQQFYERVAYANEHFSSGKPGRMTDRGRIYIKFGKPDSVESHPTGGGYDRMPWEGGGSTTTYPFERWYYRYLPNGRSGLELEFVDPSGSGEYRLARSPDEKDALLHMGGGPTWNELAGLESRADRLLNGGVGLANYRRIQDSPFEVLDLIKTLDQDLPHTRNYIGSLTGTPTVDDSTINFDTQINFFRQ